MRCQARGGEWVKTLQLLVQSRPTEGAGLRFNISAQGGVGGRHVVQPVNQCLVIQHGATHKQRQFAPRRDVCHQALGIAGKLGGAVGVQRVTDVDQVVRNPRQFRRGRLGGADIHASVNQGGIHAYYFCATVRLQCLGNGQCRTGFSARGRSYQGDMTG